MTLYQSRNDSSRWYAYSEETGWVTFQDTTGQWAKRHSTRKIIRLMFARCISGLGYVSLARRLHSWMAAA